MGQGKAEWLSTMEDPFRHQLLAAGEDLPEQMRACAAPVQGEPAHDPDLVAKLAAEIDLPPEASFEHPVLEQAVRIGLAHIDATFEGDHPKYGVGHYGQEEHDDFPPTIVAAVDALTLWGRVRRAEEVFSYWLRTFVRPDGTIDYYGPSLSEYGMVLTSAARLVARGGSPEWLDGNSPALGRIAAHLRELLRAEGGVSLLPGVPEADEREIIATYFHNNAWVARGLLDWAGVIEKTGADA